MNIAVLMTCYNRVQTTLKCLERFTACEKPDGCQFEIFLVDDGSPDHTGEAVSQNFPTVRVIQGTGSLYWCGGMRLAWEMAAKHAEYDVFLWLNDDTFLLPDALLVLAKAAEEACIRKGDAGIIVGAVCDPDTGQTTYGFTGKPPRSPDGSLLALRGETINGNVVWVSRKTWLSIGGMRDVFTHAMGDTDYGVRAVKKKIPIWLTPKHIGTCQVNSAKTWDDSSLTLRERWSMLHSHKGCPPRQFAQLVRVAHPQLWIKYVMKLYWRVIFPRRQR